MLTNVCKNEKKPDIYLLLLPSIISILISVVCLVGSTFAWYTATAETGTNSITLSNFNVSEDISGAARPENGIYFLSAGDYAITLTSSGTATSGFVILRFNGAEDVHTVPIITGESVTVNLTLSADATIEIIGSWGTSSKPESEKISFSADGVGSYTYNP